MVTQTRAYKWGKNNTQRLLKIDFIRFGIVGGIGFVVNAVILKILHGTLGLDIIIATLIGSEGGLLSNFVFHEKWTYKYVDHHYKSLWTKFWRFHMSSWSGVVLITIIEGVLVKVFHVNYLLSLVIASAITMFWNYFWTTFFIFSGKTPRPLLNPEDTVPEIKR